MSEPDVDGATEEITDLSNESVITKYRDAAEIVNHALAEVIKMCVVGADVFELCVAGDKFINDKCHGVYNAKKAGKKVEKGVAFPTCINVNEICGHFSPSKAEDSSKLQSGDVVKIDLGCHIDGYISVTAHTVAVGFDSKNKVTGRKADVVKAAWTAAEVALRKMTIGNKNSDVTSVVSAVAKEYNVTPLEGVLSHQLKKHVIDGNQVILLREAAECKVDEFTFQANEVYAIDIIFSTGEGKPKETELRTTVFKRAVEANYNLKIQKARQFVADVHRRFPTLPFTLRAFENETVCRVGVTECLRHDLLVPYPVLQEKPEDVVAHFKFTVLLLPGGTRRISGASFDQESLVDAEEIVDEELKALLATSANPKTRKRKEKDTAAKASPQAPA